MKPDFVTDGVAKSVAKSVANPTTERDSRNRASACAGNGPLSGEMAGDASTVWAQWPREPERWFARFEVFRTLGPQRSLVEAYALVARAQGLRAKSPGKHWKLAAETWQWHDRATAWDRTERARLHALESERRFDARELRLAMIDRLLEAVFRVLIAAEMDKVDREEARAWLPTLRIFFKDLLQAQRSEWSMPIETGSTEITLHADDLLQAQAALEKWEAERARLLADNREGKTK